MKKAILIGLISILWIACGDNEIPIPKPRGFMRVELPEKQYVTFNGDCPYTFEYPQYAVVENLMGHDTSEYCYKNILFKTFRGTIHLTYKKLNNNVARYIDECHNLAYDHSIKATAIDRQQFVNDSARVFGLLYDIQGNAASPLQFYVTDSTDNFIRGALYFEAKPNYDSIRPVLDFVREDVMRFIESLRWK